MSTDAQVPAEAQRPALSKVGTLARFAVIGGVLVVIMGTFAYLGGWLTPKDLRPAEFADEFERVAGVHSGFRRNHAKGVGVSGFFESNGAAARLSKATVFQVGHVPVTGRFSLAGGQPYMADAPDIIRGLGLKFSLPNGEQWRTTMNSIPVFLVNTPAAFYERLVASRPDPTTGKPDPAKMKAFLASHPETVRAMKIISSHPPASGLANSTYSSLNAFFFINTNGVSTPVRLQLVPVDVFEPTATNLPAQENENYLFDALIGRIHQGPVQWHLILTVGQPRDPTNDATIPWPEGRERIDAGTLTLSAVENEETSVARDINFDPLALPAGIVPSDDPLLSARSAVYSQSFTRRAGETKEPSAVTSVEAGK
jgi:catalase